MTKEAPERLWIEWAGGEIEGVEAFGYLEKQPFTFEYLRADLVPLWCSDMEAAPKDGTRILTFHPADPTAIIERARRDNWVINEWRGRSWYRSLPEQPPIAWMPLLAPPKGGE